VFAFLWLTDNSVSHTPHKRRTLVSGNALANSGRNDLLGQLLLSVARDWPLEAGECKASALCCLVAETGAATYDDCVVQLSVLLQQGELKIEPQQRGLYIP
jgi:hypothetical protein